MSKVLHKYKRIFFQLIFFIVLGMDFVWICLVGWLISFGFHFPGNILLTIRSIEKKKSLKRLSLFHMHWPADYFSFKIHNLNFSSSIKFRVLKRNLSKYWHCCKLLPWETRDTNSTKTYINFLNNPNK